MSAAAAIGLFSSIGLVVGYFLPWVSVFGHGVSGYQLFGDRMSLAWIVPATGVLSTLLQMNPNASRASRGMVAILGSLAVLGSMLYLVIQATHTLGDDALSALNFGAFAVVLSACGLFYAGAGASEDGPQAAQSSPSVEVDVPVEFDVAGASDEGNPAPPASDSLVRSCPHCGNAMMQKDHVCAYCKRRSSAQATKNASRELVPPTPTRSVGGGKGLTLGQGVVLIAVVSALFLAYRFARCNRECDGHCERARGSAGFWGIGAYTEAEARADCKRSENGCIELCFP